MILEVCCGKIESVHAAVKGGAVRIELCRDLPADGLTPFPETLREVRRLYPSLTIHVLIRPRDGDFVYDAATLETMAAQIREAVSLGADGIVTGALTPGSDVDEAAMRPLIEASQGLPVTFHRAFDRCCHPFAAMERIAALGCRRILTSGQAPSAEEGMPLLRELQDRAPRGLIILPGGGVSALNAARIVEYTDCKEIHASASVETGGEKTTSADKVRAILKALMCF